MGTRANGRIDCQSINGGQTNENEENIRYYLTIAQYTQKHTNTRLQIRSGTFLASGSELIVRFLFYPTTKTGLPTELNAPNSIKKALSTARFGSDCAQCASVSVSPSA